MAKVYDIPATDFIAKLADRLKKEKKIEPPAWSTYVKTGSHVEKIPQNRDWWYIRCASLIRKVYLHGPIGTSDLRSMYGGRIRVGYNLDHHRDAGGSIIRKALQQLESAGYLTKKKQGRLMSDEGMKKVDRLATEIFRENLKIPNLQRYA